MKRTYIFITFGLLLLSALALFVAGGSDLEAAEGQELWSTRCSDGATGKDVKRGTCEVFQRLNLKETNQRLIEFAVGFPEGRDDARGIIVLPLGVLLEPGVEMQVDDQSPLKFKVRYCDAKGCFAYISLNNAVLDMLRKGDKARIIFSSPKPQKIQIDMSLKGFAKALKAVS